ncbi:DUF4190 domain-containing protein [Dactylosporangium sp. CS-047395]|uniref:DUF4190 domain-containing protein n=1 Tax=Dactylosporangium sp. CS-047395 TaxID=3239936 RepID=UPI003D9287C8
MSEDPNNPTPPLYPQQPQQYYQPYTPLPPVNTYAILAAVFAFVVFPPLGIYFGRKAREQIAMSGERGIELAKVGIIAGWILSVLYLGFMVLWCGLVGVGIFGGMMTSP